MATRKQCVEFIETIAPLMQEEAKKRGYKVVSTAIAQACIESAYGTSSLGKKYHNYFGMKTGKTWEGKRVALKTKEEYVCGVLTQIMAYFRAYDSMEEGVKGYYDFLSATRYMNIKTATNFEQYAKLLKQDGYATSSKYVDTLCNTVSLWNLVKYDNMYSNESVTLYYPRYKGQVTRSIVVALDSLNIDSSYEHRKRIAKANSIANYQGTANQNNMLYALLVAGKLKVAE